MPSRWSCGHSRRSSISTCGRSAWRSSWMKPNPPRRLKHFPDAAGLDEAGRGPLAGPVVAAAVILPKGFRYVGIDDSKKLDAKARAELEVKIKAKAIYAVEIAEVD